MPTVQKPVAIAVKNNNLNTGEYIKITNLTSGNTIRIQVDSNKEAVVNPSDLGYTWNEGDSLSIESNGRIVFNSASTISKGGVKLTDTTSSADDSPAVSL